MNPSVKTLSHLSVSHLFFYQPFIDSQNDVQSSAQQEDLVFENSQQNTTQNRRPVNIDPDKIIQYEMISKGSEKAISSYGDAYLRQGVNGLHPSSLIQESLNGGVSGTPTEVSNYINQQTYYQINYIANQGASDHSLFPYQVQMNLSNVELGRQRNNPSAPSGQLSSKHIQLHRPSHQFEQVVVAVKPQMPRENLTLKDFQDGNMDLGQFEAFGGKSGYHRLQGLLSPRHVRAAVLKYD